ncbi:type II secretion system F family protein [Rothia sp. BD8]|uniref:type II secretion system F family protein n=1 Tax=Rothia sp. BD8 TaxID=2953894 RepID=UPI003842DC53
MTGFAMILGAVLALWGRHPLRRAGSAVAREPSRAAGIPAAIRLELIGAMLDAGLSVTRAVSVLAEVERATSLRRVAALLEAGLDWDRAWAGAADQGAQSQRGQSLRGQSPLGQRKRRAGEQAQELRILREALDIAVRTGAPAAALLRAQAGRIRNRRHRDAQKQAAALGVRLMLPLGLCSLPAFVCLGVIPVLIGLVPALW